MRIGLAIGLLGLVGCSSQAVIVEDMDECEVTQIIHNERLHVFSVETYKCSGEEVYEVPSIDKVSK